MNDDTNFTPDTAREVAEADDVAVPSVMARLVNYTHALDNIKNILLSDRDIGAVLQAVCVEAAQSLPSADMVGITVLNVGKNPETAASTDPAVNDVDADQYLVDEGPCLEAARTGRMVRVKVDEVARRWPRFAANVAGKGIRSYLSAPLVLDEEHVGALNLYSRGPHGFGHTDEVLIRLFVTAVEAAITVSRRAQSAEDEVRGLMTAMRTRADIEQAKGIIMAVRGITADEAFEVISEQSQNRNIKVTDIAASMIESIRKKPRPDALR